MLRENWRGSVLVAAIGLLAMSSVGCSWRIGRVLGETVFIAGAYNATDPHPRREVIDASTRAIWEMGFTIDTQEADRDELILEAVKGPNVIRVHLMDAEGGGTNISYHVDSFGKWFPRPRRLARTLLQKTQANLGTAAPAKAPAVTPAPAPAPAPAPVTHLGPGGTPVSAGVGTTAPAPAPKK